MTQPLSIGNTGDMLDVFFVDPMRGWAVGTGGKVYGTVDGGASWQAEATGMSIEFLRRIQFTSTGNGYAVGNRKTLLKYSNQVGIPGELQTNAVRIWPNPGRIVSLRLENSQLLSANLFDQSGKTVPINPIATQDRRWQLDLRSLIAGLYILRIETSGGWINKKIMVR
jgi:hypothetical protein